jgi:acetyl-CoA carboxylase biotin carboxyl carrier protein
MMERNPTDGGPNRAMFDLKKIKELIKLMVSNDLTELDLQGDNERVTLKRGIGESDVRYIAQAPPSVAGEPIASSTSSGGQAAGAAASSDADGTVTITSPMVGTYYTSSSPDAKPFGAVGDRVDADTVVCIIEAMKVFNEIKAEMAGTIEKLLVSNGDSVEFGQPMFLVRPD